MTPGETAAIALAVVLGVLVVGFLFYCLIDFLRGSMRP